MLTGDVQKLLLHHLAITVQNLDRMEEFYTRVIGLRVIEYKLHKHGSRRAVWLDGGEMIIMLELLPENAQKQAQQRVTPKENEPGFYLVAFRIDANERATWRQRLIDQEVTIVSESEYSLYFHDPEGNPLALSHYPNAS